MASHTSGSEAQSLYVKLSKISLEVLWTNFVVIPLTLIYNDSSGGHAENNTKTQRTLKLQITSSKCFSYWSSFPLWGTTNSEPCQWWSAALQCVSPSVWARWVALWNGSHSFCTVTESSHRRLHNFLFPLSPIKWIATFIKPPLEIWVGLSLWNMIIKKRTRNQNLSVGILQLSPFKCRAVLDAQVVAPSVDLVQFILLSEKLLCLQCSYYRAYGPFQ